VADGGIDIKVSSQAFTDLAAKLKGPASKTLRANLQKQIRLATAPVLADLKQAAMDISTKADSPTRTSLGSGNTARAMHAGSRKIQSKRDHGLRATIARAIQLKITLNGPRTGVRLRVDTTQLPAEQGKLPGYLDSGQGWRHPIFGTDVWVTQKGKPWWGVTIDKHVDEIRQRISAAVKDTTDQL
jgi:hypothetical protein